MGRSKKEILHTVKHGVVDGMEISTKFPDMRIPLVDGRVPGKSTTGLANLPAHCTDPGTNGRSFHEKGGGEKRWQED